MRDPLFLTQTIQPRDFSVLLNIVRAWVFLAVDDVRLQFLQVVLIDVLAEGQFLGHEERNADLIGVQTGVWGND